MNIVSLISSLLLPIGVGVNLVNANPIDNDESLQSGVTYQIVKKSDYTERLSYLYTNGDNWYFAFDGYVGDEHVVIGYGADPNTMSQSTLEDYLDSFEEPLIYNSYDSFEEYFSFDILDYWEQGYLTYDGSSSLIFTYINTIDYLNTDLTYLFDVYPYTEKSVYLVPYLNTDLFKDVPYEPITDSYVINYPLGITYNNVVYYEITLTGANGIYLGGLLDSNKKQIYTYFSDTRSYMLNRTLVGLSTSNPYITYNSSAYNLTALDDVIFSNMTSNRNDTYKYFNGYFKLNYLQFRPYQTDVVFEMPMTFYYDLANNLGTAKYYAHKLEMKSITITKIVSDYLSFNSWLTNAEGMLQSTEPYCVVLDDKYIICADNIWLSPQIKFCYLGGVSLPNLLFDYQWLFIWQPIVFIDDSIINTNPSINGGNNDIVWNFFNILFESPVTMLKNAFNFEILGINIKDLLLFFISVGVALLIYGVFRKK